MQLVQIYMRCSATKACTLTIKDIELRFVRTSRPVAAFGPAFVEVPATHTTRESLAFLVFEVHQTTLESLLVRATLELNVRVCGETSTSRDRLSSPGAFQAAFTHLTRIKRLSASAPFSESCDFA